MKTNLGKLIAEWQFLNFSYDITPPHILDKISKLEKEIKDLEEQGWRYEFKRETYTAFYVCVRKYQNGRLKYQGCINEYFETEELAQQWIKTAPITENGFTFKYNTGITTKYRDIHIEYNIND